MLRVAARQLIRLSTFKHPNVLRLLGIVEFCGQIGIVYAWAGNGSLPAYLEQNPDVNRCRMSKGICTGLRYLHWENMVHGDLKGLNILIDKKGTPKLANFGNTVLPKLTGTTTMRLSPRWAAPELMEGHGAKTFAADVYSLGMTILETITGKVPYFDKTELELEEKRGLPLRPEDSIPSNSEDGNKLWDLLMCCWVYDPENRPSAQHVENAMADSDWWDLRSPIPKESGGD